MCERERWVVDTVTKVKMDTGKNGGVYGLVLDSTQVNGGLLMKQCKHS